MYKVSKDTQGSAFSILRGGSFKTGFISGFASHPVAEFESSLIDADDFTKLTINAIISGAIAKAAGGDFSEGAFRAMVVWLYNYDYIDPRLKAAGVPDAMASECLGSCENQGEVLFKNIQKTNDKRVFGPFKLINATDDKVSMVKVGEEKLNVNIGKINYSAPFTYNSLNKSYSIVNIGFNTATAESSWKIGNLKLTFMFQTIGLGLTAKIGKSGGIGFTAGLVGGSILWDYTDE